MNRRCQHSIGRWKNDGGLGKERVPIAEDSNEKQGNCILGSSKDSEMGGSKYHKR